MPWVGKSCHPLFLKEDRGKGFQVAPPTPKSARGRAENTPNSQNNKDKEQRPRTDLRFGGVWGSRLGGPIRPDSPPPDGKTALGPKIAV